MDKTFEQELTKLNQLDIPSIDGESFTQNLHLSMEKQAGVRRQMLSTFAASVFILFLGIVTFYQLDSTMGYETYYAEIESTYFDMDLWENESEDLVQESDDYYDHLAVLLLEEDNIWDSIEFFDEMNYLTNTKEI